MPSYAAMGAGGQAAKSFQQEKREREAEAHERAGQFWQDQLESEAHDAQMQANLEDRARKNNDSLGADVGMYAGRVIIKMLPVQAVEYLTTNASTTYPFYAINWKYLFPFVMEGDNFRETGPLNDRTQHDVFTTFVDLQFNFCCTNRQRVGGIISAVAA